MTTLYDILGIDSNASTADIKKAYRKKAQALHPDRGTGDEDKFKELSAAYEVLIDEMRRASYDETGEIRNEASLEGQVLRDLVAIVFNAIDHTEDVRYDNVLEVAKTVVNNGLEKANAQMGSIEESIKDRREVIRRLKRKKGQNLIAEAIEVDIGKRLKAVGDFKKAVECGLKVLTALDEYEYSTDQRQQPVGVFFTGHTTTIPGFRRR